MQIPTDVASSDIEKDITRTFPDTKRFASEEGQAALRNVLVAYANYDAEVAYCQGMNFIAGLLLTYLSEAEAFAGMVLLMEDRGLRGVFKQQLGLVQVRARRDRDQAHPPTGAGEDHPTVCRTSCWLLLCALEEASSSAIVKSKKLRSKRALHPVSRAARSKRAMLCFMVPQVQLWQLGKLLDQKIMAHLEGLGVTPDMFAWAWLMTSFAADFPIQFSSRWVVWVVQGHSAAVCDHAAQAAGLSCRPTPTCMPVPGPSGPSA